MPSRSFQQCLTSHPNPVLTPIARQSADMRNIISQLPYHRMVCYPPFQDLAEFSSFEADIVARRGIKRGRCCRWKGSAQRRSSVDEGMVEDIRSAGYLGSILWTCGKEHSRLNSARSYRGRTNPADSSDLIRSNIRSRRCARGGSKMWGQSLNSSRGPFSAPVVPIWMGFHGYGGQTSNRKQE